MTDAQRIEHLRCLLSEALPYVERCPVPYVVQTRNSLLERMRKEIPADSTGLRP